VRHAVAPQPLGRRLARSGGFWFTAWLCWFGVLFFLSSRPLPEAPPEFGFLQIPHADKVAHFGWFFAGALALAAAIHCAWRPRARNLIIAVVVLMSAVGALDEYHQSFHEFRSGNDLGDWVADTLGATAGAVAFVWLRGRVRRKKGKLSRCGAAEP